MTADDITKLLKVALKKFGTHNFDDKGPHEVMDVDSIAESLMLLPIQEVASILEKIAEIGDREQTLVKCILACLQTIPDKDSDYLASIKILGDLM